MVVIVEDGIARIDRDLTRDENDRFRRLMRCNECKQMVDPEGHKWTCPGKPNDK